MREHANGFKAIEDYLVKWCVTTVFTAPVHTCLYLYLVYSHLRLHTEKGVVVELWNGHALRQSPHSKPPEWLQRWTIR